MEDGSANYGCRRHKKDGYLDTIYLPFVASIYGIQVHIFGAGVSAERIRYFPLRIVCIRYFLVKSTTSP
jgi:hypothetical protein